MNKSVGLFLAMLFLRVDVFSQEQSLSDSIIVFADSAFSVFERYSLYGEKMDWEERKKLFLQTSKDFKRFEEVFPMFQRVFDDLSDKHSFFWYDNRKYASNYGQPNEADMRKPLIEALNNGKAKITAKVFDNIGYIMIPQDNSLDDQAKMKSSVQNLHDSICNNFSGKIQGWIIDLRLNTGGNMYPMILAISSFLGDGMFAGTIDRDNNRKEWRIEGKSIFEDDQEILELEEVCLPDLSQMPVAVLISQITGSSGEIIALALLNRPRTLFIGEPTAGFMTANELFRLPFGVFLLLTNANEIDSNGKVVDVIQPQKSMVEGDNFDDLEEDAKIQEAIRWLRQQNQKR